MFFARIAAIVAAASVLWGGSASAAGPLRAFQVGLWSGGAYTDDRTGDFTHCSAGVAYDSGINMFVLVTGSYRWWLGFINPQWALAPNTRLAVELRLDDGPPFARAATVPSGQLLLVPLPDNSRLLDTFRRSSRMELNAERESFLFKLSNTSGVMDELDGCVRRSVALEARASSTPPPTAASAASEVKGAPASAPTSSVTPAPAQAALVTDAPMPVPPESPETPTNSAPRGSTTPAASAGWSPATPPVTRESSATPSPPAAPKSATAASPQAAQAPPAPAPSVVASAAPEMPASLAAATAPPFAPLPQTAREPVTPTAVEEVRLATDFFTTAQLPNARLVVTDKPAALANFTAVWRSDDAAGAVEIIPPGPDVNGIGIASNLIAVDPQMCKGDFATARSSANVDSKLVFSAVLSCTEANEQRTAQYFITPRRRGGFVVFAVVGSSAATGTAESDQQRLDLFTRAAARAAGNDG